MKTLKSTLSMLVVLVVLLTGTLSSAGDFDWTKNLNIRAEADPTGFRAQLSTRFDVGDARVKVVLGNVDNPADAYMVLRLGEMSSRPVDYVLTQYRANKNKGWGAIAKSLGIKPGSKQFHALKQGSDLGGSGGNGGNKNTGKGKGKKNKG